jgi:hypothetical protein
MLQWLQSYFRGEYESLYFGSKSNPKEGRKMSVILHQPGEDPNSPSSNELIKSGIKCIFLKIDDNIHCVAVGAPMMQEEAELYYAKLRELETIGDFEKPVIVTNETDKDLKL